MPTESGVTRDRTSTVKLRETSAKEELRQRQV